MHLRKGFSKASFLLALVTAVVLATNVAAYNNRDFLAPPDWMAHGNDRSNAGYGSVEPINVVISGNSSFDLVSYLQQRDVGWNTCGVSNLQANVQPGGHYVNQVVELRQGGCFEFSSGGNHLRAWRQNLLGGHWDYFMAVSEEHDCWVNGGPWHCIDPVGWNGGAGGFNQGRNDFVQFLTGYKDLGVDGFNYLYVEQPGVYRSGHGKDAGQSGWDYVPYDGHVAVLTVAKH